MLAAFAEKRSLAQSRYAQFVKGGMQADMPWKQIKGQVFFGDEAFVQRMQEYLAAKHRDDLQIPFVQRRPPAPTFPQIQNETPDRNALIGELMQQAAIHIRKSQITLRYISPRW